MLARIATKSFDHELQCTVKNTGRKAWLVTWEWCGNHARRDPKVVAVFRPQLSGERVCELVEYLYSSSEYTLRERVHWTFNLKENPYRAQFGTIGGIPWSGEIVCGDNPFLKARLVDDLVVDGENNVTWTECPRPTGC
jgi:hypothetical protein